MVWGLYELDIFVIFLNRFELILFLYFCIFGCSFVGILLSKYLLCWLLCKVFDFVFIDWVILCYFLF